MSGIFESESLPEGKQLRNLDDLVGHTIKCVIQPSIFGMQKKKLCDYLIVTETLSWIAIYASEGECADVAVCNNSAWSADESMHDYASAKDLFQSGVINSGVFEHLRKSEDAARRDANERRIASMKAEINRLQEKVASASGDMT